MSKRLSGVSIDPLCTILQVTLCFTQATQKRDTGLVAAACGDTYSPMHRTYTMNLPPAIQPEYLIRNSYTDMLHRKCSTVVRQG